MADVAATPAVNSDEITLSISLNIKTGNFRLAGPIHDEPLCDWLMKKAGRQLENMNNAKMAAFIKAQQAGEIEAAPPEFLKTLARGKNGLIK